MKKTNILILAMTYFVLLLVLVGCGFSTLKTRKRYENGNRRTALKSSGLIVCYTEDGKTEELCNLKKHGEHPYYPCKPFNRRGSFRMCYSNGFIQRYVSIVNFYNDWQESTFYESTGYPKEDTYYLLGGKVTANKITYYESNSKMKSSIVYESDGTIQSLTCYSIIGKKEPCQKNKHGIE